MYKMLFYLFLFFNLFLGLSLKNNPRNSLLNVYELVNQKKIYSYLSTINYNHKLNNYPHTSLVGFCSDEKGYPILCMSDISQHTKNVKKNNNTSILIPKFGLTHQNEKRVTITGNIDKIIDNYENKHLIELYKENHPEAFWLNYIDFNLYRMNNIKDINYIGGFGEATKISVSKYLINYK